MWSKAMAPVKPDSCHSSTKEPLYVYIYIKAISDVNMKEQKFRLVYSLYLQWHPSKRELDSYNTNQPDKITLPRILPSNMISMELEELELREGGCAVHLLEDGGVDIWGMTVSLDDKTPLMGVARNYVAIISAPFGLNAYPFDCQSLHVFFETSKTTIQLMPTPILKQPCCMIEVGALASDPDYKIYPPVIEFNDFEAMEGSTDMFACATVTLKLERISTGFVFRILLPCSLITLMAMSVFFVSDFESADRLSVLSTSMLALVALLFVVSESIPKVPYLTMADKFLSFSLVFVSLLAFYVCVSMTGEISAEDDHMYGIFYASSWAFMHLLFFILALVAKWRSGKTRLYTYSELSDKDLLVENSQVLECAKTAVLYGK